MRAEYVDLDPTTAADLVLRAKQTQPPQAPPPPQQQYGMPPQQRGPPPPQYNNYPPRGPPPPQQAVPPPAGNPADISRIMSSLSQPGSSAPPPANNADLARLMAGMNPQQGGRPGSTGITPDVAQLLGQMGQPPPQGGHGQPMPAVGSCAVSSGKVQACMMPNSTFTISKQVFSTNACTFYKANNPSLH